MIGEVQDPYGAIVDMRAIVLALARVAARNTPDDRRVAPTMIEVHVAMDQTGQTDVERELVELVVAHRVVPTDPTTSSVGLPAVREHDRWYEGDSLAAYLEELRRTVALWRKYQSDACYVEDDGSIC